MNTRIFAQKVLGDGAYTLTDDTIKDIGKMSLGVGRQVAGGALWPVRHPIKAVKAGLGITAVGGVGYGAYKVYEWFGGDSEEAERARETAAIALGCEKDKVKPTGSTRVNPETGNVEVGFEGPDGNTCYVDTGEKPKGKEAGLLDGLLGKFTGLFKGENAPWLAAGAALLAAISGPILQGVGKIPGFGGLGILGNVLSSGIVSTLLTIVAVVALGFGVAKLFGKGKETDTHGVNPTAEPERTPEIERGQGRGRGVPDVTTRGEDPAKLREEAVALLERTRASGGSAARLDDVAVQRDLAGAGTPGHNGNGNGLGGGSKGPG